MRRKLVAGNWKMNGLSSSLDEVRAMTTVANTVSCGMVVIPPFTLIERVSAL